MIERIFDSVRKHAHIITFRSYAELRAERERTYLGLFWWVLEPILFMAVFYLIFGYVRGTGGAEFVAFLLTGLVIWLWFRSTIAHCGYAIQGGLRLMRQIALPPVVFPLIFIMTDTIKFLIVLTLLLITLPLLGQPLGWTAFYLPLVLLVQLVLIIGVCLIYASVVPFVPDLKFLMDTALMALMFLSGIFYTIDSLRGEYAWIVAYNPMTGLIDDARRVLMHGLPPVWPRLVAIALLACVLVAIGSWMVSRFARHYTKLPG